MRKFALVVALFVTGVALICPRTASAYDFGDYKSATLVSKAWAALAAKDLDGVLAYTNKCIELYAEKAQAMQVELKDYAVYTVGDDASKDKVFSYWALNDVATAYYIQGQAYQQADKKDEAKKAYTTVIEKYTFGQCWDTQGWFWKPAEAAKDKVKIMDSGVAVDFGNYSSSYLVGQAWKALTENDLDRVLIFTDKTIEMYATKAKEMQASLKEYAWESKDKIQSYWALNDVGTALYIKGEAYRKAGKAAESKEAFQKLVSEFSFAQCWDPQGWFWKPAEVAQQALAAAEASTN
ncbi:MAG: tetratricopeptide repeat protein [Candidatus Omnitrophica bacterium]|nr:tetratricopeptide repeat protein [Candidatus Omnitrophota bacterium]